MEPLHRVSRWRGVSLALIAFAAVAVAIVLIVDNTGGSGSGSATQSGGQASTPGAATVQRRNLVATDTESGTLGYAESQTVYDRLSGTITSLPAVGAVIRPGQTLYRVANQPVVLFDGSTPAYRDLSPAVSDGPDVYELNRNLVKLGFDADQITVDDVWQPATTYGVDLWQASLGEPETGTIPLGQIVFLPGAQRITAVDTVLGSTGQSSGAASSGSGGTSSSTTVITRPEFVDLRTTPTHSGHARTRKHKRAPWRRRGRPGRGRGQAPGGPTSRDSAAILAALKALLKAEAEQLKREGSAGSSGSGSGSSRSGSGSSRSGSSGSGSSGSGSSGSGSGSSGSAQAQAVLGTASTNLVVSVQLAATMKSEAVVGERVTVELPDGSTVDGKVTQVSSVAQSNSSSGSGSGSGSGGGANGSSGAPSATIPVTVALTGRHPSVAGLDQAAVSVNFVQQQAKHVLSVPVTALLATAGGGYTVQEAGAPHRLIPVTPGLFAAGYVQISGAGIYAGLQVTDSQG